MENQTFIIEDELKKLPGKPGVYLMHGEKDEIIYVGKAISLKNRVRQYFQPSRNRGAKIDQMVTHITRFEYRDGFGTGSTGSGMQSDQGTPAKVQYDADG